MFYFPCYHQKCFRAVDFQRLCHGSKHVLFHTSCKSPSSGRSSAPACGTRCSAPTAPRLVTRAVIRRRFVIVHYVSPPPLSGRSVSIVRQVSLSRSVPGVSYFCRFRPHTWMTLTMTLPETLPGWTWVRVKFGLDRPSRLAGYTEHRSWQTNISPFII